MARPQVKVKRYRAERRSYERKGERGKVKGKSKPGRSFVMPAQAGIQGFFKDGFRLETCRNDAIEFPFLWA